MRGEGFNPEISKEAGRESAAKEIGRRERSFLDSMRQGAERHKLALAFLFSGALAESMSGTARAQEAGSSELASEDGAELIPENQLEKSELDCQARFDDIRAPLIFIDGFEEKYRVMQTQKFVAAKRPGSGIEKSVTHGPAQVRANDLSDLQDHRLIVTQGVAQLVVEKTGASSGVAFHEEVRSETAVYASDGAENDVEGARSFESKGWGGTEEQALLNALEHAAIYLGARVRSESVREDKQSVSVGQDKKRASVRSESGAVAYSSSQTASVIEGFSVVKTEKISGAGGQTEFVVSIEGLGSSLVMEPFQEQ